MLCDSPAAIMLQGWYLKGFIMPKDGLHGLVIFAWLFRPFEATLPAHGRQRLV